MTRPRKPRSDGTERFAAYLKREAEFFGLPTTHALVQRAATAQLLYDNKRILLLNGGDVSTDEFLRIDAALAEIRAQKPEEQVTLNVNFIERAHGPVAAVGADEPKVTIPVELTPKGFGFQPRDPTLRELRALARAEREAMVVQAMPVAAPGPTEESSPAPAASPPEPPKKLTPAECSEKFHSHDYLKPGQTVAGGGIPGVAGPSMGDLMGGMSNHSRTYANGLTRDPHPFRRGGGYA